MFVADNFFVGIGKTMWLHNHMGSQPTNLTPFLASLPWFAKDSRTPNDDYFIWKRVLRDSPSSMSPSF